MVGYMKRQAALSAKKVCLRDWPADRRVKAELVKELLIEVKKLESEVKEKK
jgi:hypothetical protein